MFQRFRLAAVQSIAVVCLFAAAPLAAHAATLTVAVAANFKAAAQDIGTAFHKQTGDTVQYAFGATGQLAGQIRNGAPFDVLLAADDTTGPKLAEAGVAGADSAFIYAQGTLVLYSTSLPVKAEGAAALKQADYTHLAIANPKTAPYGAAAVSVLQKMGLYDQVKPRIVEGGNIGQAFDFTATGNAQLGFVALSQAIAAGKGEWWTVPAADYAPIRQGAIVLKPGEGKPVVTAYLDFLRGPIARKIIEQYGYAIPR